MINSSISLFIILLSIHVVFCRDPNAAQNCELTNARCSELKYCREAIQALKSGRRPEICGFKGDQPLVCCNITYEPFKVFKDINARISQKMCETYDSYFCPRGSAFSLGGVPAKPRELPFMALVGYGEENDKSWLCGGSLISHRYVLSAAHCSESGDQGPARWVRLGDLDKSTNTDDAKPQDFSIAVRFNHPDYKPPLLYNDLALYRLDRAADFNFYVKPICLLKPVTKESRSSALKRSIFSAGWGRIGFVGPLSNELLKVQLDIFPLSRCSKTGDISQLPRGIENGKMICAGSETGERDTCQGDSGGPLFSDDFHNDCLFSQIGITSFGTQCGLAEFPGVYTNITHHLTWIESIVWPLNSTDVTTVWN